MPRKSFERVFERLEYSWYLYGSYLTGDHVGWSRLDLNVFKMSFLTHFHALFMALRYADNVNNEIMVKQLLSTSMQYTKRVIRKNSEDVTMLSFWLANIVKLLCLFKQYSGEEEFSKRNTVEQNQHNLLNFDLCEFRQVFHDMAVSAYQRLVQASERKIKPLIIPAMLEEDTIQGGRSGGVNYSVDDDEGGHTALESMLIQMSKWNVMFHKHGLDNGLIRQFFNQIFYFITSTTLNTQLVRKELCNWSKAMQIRYNTSQLEDWLRKEKLETASITERLEPLVQVSQLLQVNKESDQDADEIVQLCTKLSAAQVCKLLALVTPVYDHEKRVSVQFTKMVQEKMVHANGGTIGVRSEVWVWFRGCVYERPNRFEGLVQDLRCCVPR